MKIRLHIDNQMCIGSGLHHTDTVVMEVSFFMWLKAFFFGLDLCCTSLMFPKLETDKDSHTNEIKPLLRPTSKATPYCSEPCKVETKRVGHKKTKSKKTDKVAHNDADVFGIQFDDNTVVFPDGRKEVITSSPVPEHDLKANHVTDEDIKELPNQPSSVQPSTLINLVQHVQSEDKVEIDFRNPPHSPRWKPRNLPPRPVRKPRPENL
jgi:hypothetical protein